MASLNVSSLASRVALLIAQRKNIRRMTNPSHFFLVSVSYVLLSTVLMAITREIQIAPDTARYTDINMIFSTSNPGILTTFLISTVGTTKLLLVIQSLISAVAWLTLSVALQRFVGGNWGKNIGFLVLLYSLTGPIVTWNWWALSESLTLSFCVMWVAVPMLVLSLEKTNFRGYAMLSQCTVGLLLVLIRPQLVLFIMPMQLFLFLVFSGKASVRFRFALVVILILTTGWSTVRISQVASDSNLQYWYSSNNFVAKSSYRDFARNRIDVCPHVDQTVVSFEALSEIRGNLNEVCPELWNWLNSPNSRWNRWVVAEPLSAFREYFSYLSSASLFEMHQERGVLPGVIDELLTYASISVFEGLFVTLLITSFLYKRSLSRLLRRKFFVGLLLSTLCGIFLYSFVAWASDGMEVDRHMLPIMPLIPLAVFVSVAILLHGHYRKISDA